MADYFFIRVHNTYYHTTNPPLTTYFFRANAFCIFAKIRDNAGMSESERDIAPESSGGEKPLLAVEQVEKHFVVGGEFSGQQAVVRALNGVSLSIRRGEIFCVVGESGCGKSTLARVVLGLIQPNAGKVFFDGKRVDNLPEGERRRFRRRMQMIFQNPQASLNPRMRAGQTLAEALRFHFPGLSAAEVSARVVAALEATGLDASAIPRLPHEFSGGQRQRVSIARALIVEPELVVADEPVAALDVSVQAQILNLMSDLRKARGLSYLFITHDLSVVEHFGARAAVMYLGMVCETAPCAELFASPRHPYSRTLLDSAPRLGRAPRADDEGIGEPPSPANIPSGCAFASRCPHAREKCRREIPLPISVGKNQIVACHAVAEGRI